MNTVSVISRSDVKQKPPAFSALPGSGDNQLEIAMADIQAKAVQNSDLPTPGLAVPAWRFLDQLIKVPIPAGHKSKLSLRVYYFLAVLDAHQGDREFCSPSIIRLAIECRVSERQIKRWIAKLWRLKYIWVDGRGKRNRYRVIRTRNMPNFVCVDPRWVYRLGLSISQAVLFGYVCFKCNGRPESWFSIHRAAADLGLCRRTIEMCLAILAAWGFIEIRPGRKSGGRTNRYQLTELGRLASWENYERVPAQKCPLLKNTPAAQRFSYANFVRNHPARAVSGLSSYCQLDQEIYELLVKLRIARSVARSIAVQWRGYIESVKQAILNAAYLFDADRETLRRHNLKPPRGTFIGYIIGTLNTAYSEGHKVKPSKLARAAAARGDGGARAAVVGRLPEVEFERRRKQLKAQLRSTPAKHTTPGKEAESAIIQQNSDKAAKAEYLDRTLAAARRSSHSLRKRANQAQKLRFSDGPCS
ncbi:hypothetical protein ES707_09785 [subsurface metagenome]